MLTDLSQSDFSFYSGYADKMHACHDQELMQEINPDIIRAFYRGRKVKKDTRFARTGYGMNDHEHLLMLSMIFGSANTILPNLYYKNPWPIITALRGMSPMGIDPQQSAALLSALIKYYMKCNDAKGENQEACLNAYWMGLGWKKVGYTRQSLPSEQVAGEPETQVEPEQKPFSFMEMLGMGKKEPQPLQSKERMEFVDKEGLFNSSESPLNVMLDHKADLRNCKAILHRVPRTLYELMNFPGYDSGIIDELVEKFKVAKGSRLDTREVDLDLNELHVRQRNGIWIMSWVDGFKKPLQYEKSTWQGRGFQLVPLSFTNEPGVRYPISHMKIAVQVQDKIDRMASLFYENVSRARNMLFVNKGDLEPGTIEAIENNKIGGIALTNKAINPGTFAHAQSPSVQNDLPTLIQMCQQNLTEVMGSDAQLTTGKSKNKTLGQDELARVGRQIRESGMQDRVKDFMIKQMEMEGTLLKEFSEATLELQITGEDFADPVMQEKVEREQIEFMTMQNPMAARRYLESIEYNYDMNIEEIVRPDHEKKMVDIERVIAFTTNPIVQNAINEDGFIVRVGALSREWLEQVESLGNPKKYLTPIDSMQLAAIQTKRMLMEGGGSKPATPAPTQRTPGQTAASNPSSAPKSSQMAKEGV